MAKRTITALYDSYDQASQAVRKLEAMGIPHSDISIVANNKDDRYSSHAKGRSHDGDDSHDDSHADDGAGTGATLGTVVGGGAGALAGLGLLTIPGLGPVVAAGWLISTLTGAGVGAAVGGLVGSLVGAGVPEEHAHAYAEGVKRGGTLVTVRAEETYVERAVDILDDHGSVDMDERETSWRSSGWKGLNDESGYTSRSGYSGAAGTGLLGAAGSTATGMNTGTSRGTDMGTTAFGHSTSGSSTDMGSGSYDRSSSTGTGTGIGGALSRAADKVSDAFTGDDDRTRTGMTGSRTGMTGDREAIPIVEEQLAVGKREVNHGRVRIHSHVVETPVQEQVSLRDETVHVERRPVDRPLSDADRAFQDRTIEAVEHDEEAVVSKQARVKEELVVSKDVQTRNQTVSDTVRRTEVEVEDDRDTRITGTTDRDRKV